MSERSEPDAHLWALDLAPTYRGGRDQPVGAHLIVSGWEPGRQPGDWDKVLISACGREHTAGSHPRGYWSTQQGNLPLQDQAVHCGTEEVLAAKPQPTPLTWPGHPDSRER